MTSRPNPFAAHYALMKPLIDFGNFSQQGLEPGLADLVKIRASQINNCGPCLFMHTHDARKNGETEDRLYLLNAWRESSLYNDRERAALAWTDALTLVSEQGAPDEAYQALRAHFSEEQQIKITLVIAVINAFNRVNVGFGVKHPVSASRKAA